MSTFVMSESSWWFRSLTVSGLFEIISFVSKYMSPTSLTLLKAVKRGHVLVIQKRKIHKH